MICPICHQPASTFLRYSFSRQGVSIAQSMQGYLKCQHCSQLLRIRYGKMLWIMLVPAFLVLMAFAMSTRSLFLLIGSGLTSLVWMLLVIAVLSVVVFGLWKNAEAIAESSADGAQRP